MKCLGFLWLLLPFKWHLETNCGSGKKKRIALYRQPGCCVEGVTFVWQILHFAKKPGSELSIAPVFAVLPLTECIFWCVLPGFWKPRLLPWLLLGSHGSVFPNSVCGRQLSPQRTGGFLMANVLQLQQSFAITCTIQHRCKACVSKKERQ